MSEKQPKPVNETELENVESEDSVDATTEQAEQNIEAELNAEAENISEEQQKINELELTLAAVKSTVEDQKDSVIRAKAEVDNIRRRSAQEVEKARKFALEKFSIELLPVIDNLERAIASINVEDETQKAIAEGVELTLQSFIAAMTKFGVKAIDPQDQPFNPEFHQAMSMQEVPGVEPNTVIAVMQKGYELNGRLIRPAMVMVSKA
jgi:molecular chaperone GrpE